MKKSDVQKFLDRIPLTLEELLDSSPDWRDDPCCLWEGSPINFSHNRNGRNKRQSVRLKVPYGIFQGRTAHSWSFNAFVRPVLKGEEVHHRCRNKSCVRPNHLEAKTPKAHALEHSRKGQRRGVNRWGELYTPKRRYKKTA